MQPFFSFLLRKCRKEAGLTQQELASAVGIPRWLISKYERNLVDPTTEDHERLARHFGRTTEDFGVVRTRVLAGPHGRGGFPRGLLKTLCRSRELYRAPDDERMQPYLVTLAKDPILDPVVKLALANPGFAEFSRYAGCESSLEAEEWVRLHVQGSHFGRMSLARLRWSHGPVMVKGQDNCLCGSLWPVLYRVDPPVVFFPQVRIITPFGPRKVDTVMAVPGSHGPTFAAIEINGGGHTGKRDQVRHAELRMPVIYLLEQDVASEDLAGRILRRYQALIREKPAA